MFKKLLSTDPSKFIDVNLSILLLRIGAGGILFTHGLPKLMKVFSGDFSFADPIGLGPEISLILAAFAEGICSLFVVLGFGTRLSSLVIAINMAVAFFIQHSGDPFGQKELALIFLMMFVITFFTGGGKYSVDKKIA
ncbi:DoxX family protein [Gracilimonas amylolytica]|uniref:DoxX family protein n=1 Tax=Gracilimonas amylolytica TaxID=1749045 RepID=UPI000CD8015B|nr:DoxX family protein [Gracilimonas amylolytica]